MPSTLAQLPNGLVKSGLISAKEHQDVANALVREGLAPSDDAVLGRLHENGALTSHQLSLVRAGRLNELAFGNYLVLDKIGAGGMGAVYKAQHRRMKRIVAIKVVSRDTLLSPEPVAWFQTEIETLAGLSHPNIVAAYDADECSLGLYLVMEYIDGCDLAELVQRVGPLSVRDAVDYIAQAARGLEYAHERRIIHRDVKPANLLRTSKGTIKVTDLGLAQLLYESSDAEFAETIAYQSTIAGTIDYMAPEQAFNPSEIDHRADIYSLGCTLFYLLTGQILFRGVTAMQRLAAHRELPPRDLRHERPEVPIRLDSIYRRMTAKRPEDRPSTMAEVIDVLESIDLPEVSMSLDAGRLGASLDAGTPTSWSLGSSITLESLSVLLAESSRVQSRMIATQLQDLGIRRIQTAGSGQSAFDMALTTRPDLVVSAMHLPDMTGADLVRRMRADATLRDIAFVLISSETDCEFLEPVRQAGAAAILPKPFKPEALHKALAVAADFFSPDAVRIHNLQAAGLKVLIVDDSRSARRHVRRVLENLGIRSIAEAADGAQALELLPHSAFDLIVSDYNMPQIDGPALVRQVRRDPSHRRTPVLMITSETDPVRLAEARAAGVSAFCPKVFDPQTVCSILGEILGGRTNA